MAQQGFVFRRYGSWFLKYRDNFLVNGGIVRKQVCVRLADYGDRYKRPSDLRDLVAEKMASVRQASKCVGSANSFVSYVETEYLPYIQRTKKASTYSGYRSYWLRYLRPRVERYALRDITMRITSEVLADIAHVHDVNVDTV